MAKVVGPASRQQEAWRLMLELVFSHRGRMLKVAQEFGLAPQQTFALRSLQPDEPMKLSDLAQALHCDNSTVTGLADRLENAGLAERQAHPTDRRVKTLMLTERGKVLRQLYIDRVSTAPDAMQSLSDEDAAILFEILSRVASPAK
ncbi:MarR family winged helix-turn-helix transcriptional regulator [Solirubrobacter soli]|uniref:MarR family winged helix-turn-helix transcriptional regulator n=1 Tax=Solirubrobacter soli TaxID=363832 RepID=UPI0007E8B8F2|nr:MarR family transcriptional regulator [Solirubrobacter soli]